MTTWTVKSGADARIRAGHPWVMDSEIKDMAALPRPGALVELRDNRGQFLARGYGNPKSRISFRALTYDSRESLDDIVLTRLKQAWQERKTLGFTGSFRLCFGEADGLPGMVVDYYQVEQNTKAQVFAVQVLSAGMSVALGVAENIFEELTKWAGQHGLSDFSWAETAVVLRNDVRVRKYEGLEIEEPRFIKSINGFDFENIQILIAAAGKEKDLLSLNCDLYRGQKTGFFLDQIWNINLTSQRIQSWLAQKKSIRILDLCSYVGHWSSQLANFAKAHGVQAETTLVDVSSKALQFAKANSERYGAKVTVLEADVLKGLVDLPDDSFDIVIADPPAFVKSKKDLGQGRHAYMQLNTQAFRLVKDNGWVVSCSCSSGMSEENFVEALRKAIGRGKKHVRCVARGGHAPDHPTLMQFPEGHYLKMYLHHIEGGRS